VSAKRATSFDVAKLAGVSRTTVSFVLNHVPGISISESTRKNVIEAARKLNYHPNESGRRLSSGKSKMIGLVLLQSAEQVLYDAFLLQVLVGLEAAASRSGFHVLLKNIQGSQSDGYSQLINENHVDGIIFSGPLQEDPLLLELHDRGFPIMLMGQMPDTVIPYVDANVERGAEAAVRHLVEQGHTRIGMITNAQFLYSTARQRRDGYLLALHAANLPIDETLIQEGDYTPVSGIRAMNALLDAPNPPSAVFVASDVVAVGAIQAIKQRNLRIPQDIAIIGFDDIPMAEYLDPPLTTIRLPAFGLGWAAGERLIRLILGEDIESQGVLLGTELIIRQSTSRELKEQTISQP
jgi:DNA-binding LacI/PurR family transcriptional regulator